MIELVRGEMESNVKVNIKQGRELANVTLCATCEFGTVVKSTSGRESVYCGRFGEQVLCSIETCTSFQSIHDPDLEAMNEIAWMLVQKKGRTVGFVTNQEYKKKYESEEY
jgi:hypothetical protein